MIITNKMQVNSRCIHYKNNSTGWQQYDSLSIQHSNGHRHKTPAIAGKVFTFTCVGNKHWLTQNSNTSRKEAKEWMAVSPPSRHQEHTPKQLEKRTQVREPWHVLTVFAPGCVMEYFGDRVTCNVYYMNGSLYWDSHKSCIFFKLGWACVLFPRLRQ